MRYLTREEVAESNKKIGKFLAAIPESEINWIKDNYVNHFTEPELEELVENFSIDLCLNNWPFCYNLNPDDVVVSDNILRRFFVILEREKYPKTRLREKRRTFLTNTPSSQRARGHWRKAVFERDEYKCCNCGSNKNLCGHHIKPRSKYPELQFDVDNGMTLCKDCHAKRHSKQANLIMSRR